MNCRTGYCGADDCYTCHPERAELDSDEIVFVCPECQSRTVTTRGELKENYGTIACWWCEKIGEINE